MPVCSFPNRTLRTYSWLHLFSLIYQPSQGLSGKVGQPWATCMWRSVWRLRHVVCQRLWRTACMVPMAFLCVALVFIVLGVSLFLRGLTFGITLFFLWILRFFVFLLNGYSRFGTVCATSSRISLLQTSNTILLRCLPFLNLCAHSIVIWSQKESWSTDSSFYSFYALVFRVD